MADEPADQPPAPAEPTQAEKDAAEQKAKQAAEAQARAENKGLSADEIKAIGEAAGDAAISRMEQRGVFDEPEPAAPAPAPATPAPGDEKPGGAADEQPAKKSFAARFLGL